MSREEDLIRSTTHAIASTVSEVPPLRLEAAADEPGGAARAPRRRLGGHGRPRRWRSWAAPLTAAALVVALAISLVIIRDLPNGTGVPPRPAASTGPDGAPRYYVALKLVTENLQTGDFQYGIVVGDSLTGKTLATFTPPAKTTFQNVTAAADDRTFVVFAVASPTGNLIGSTQDVTLTGSWYKVQLAPGTATPARLTRVPVKPFSWTGLHGITPAPGQIYATALSASGQELAVAGNPELPVGDKPQDWQQVQVFSVATGKLLRDWTGYDPTARFATAVGTTLAGVSAGTSALTWIDQDRALTLVTSFEVAGTEHGLIRRLNVAGPFPLYGDLKTDSTVLWTGALNWNSGANCYQLDAWPPPITADGNAITCMVLDMPATMPGHIDFGTAPLAPGIKANVKPKVAYRATIPPENQTGGVDYNVLWASPSGGTLIVEWVPGGNLSPPKKVHFGVASQGTYTPLAIPASMAASVVTDITF